MIKLEIKIGDVYGGWQVLRLPEKINHSKLNYCWCRCVQCGKIERYIKCTDLIHIKTKCKCQRKHKYNITKLQSIRTKSFKDWCIETNHQEFLDRWDYEMNEYTPDIVSYKSDYKIYFKCPKGKHASRAIVLRWITNLNTSCECIECNLEANSFGKWCEDNNPDILNLWDYDANKLSPYEVLKASNQKYYFKCPNGIHDSHLQIICNLTIERAPICCPKCNSIGQWIIDNMGEDYLYMLWDFDKNTKSPFDISYGASRFKIFIKCLDNLEHDSCPIAPCNFILGQRCPACKNENMSSKLQVKVQKYIKEKYKYNILHEHACILKPINPKTNYPLPYDNQVVIGYNTNLIIEVMGVQHFKVVGFIKQAANRHRISPEEELADLQWRDQFKRQYALENGFFYLAIPYWAEKDELYKKLIDSKIHEILSQTQQND